MISLRKGLVVASLCVAALVSGLAVWSAGTGRAQQSLEATYIPAETIVPLSREQVQLSFAPVVRQAAPAVVSIYTKTRVTRRFRDPVFEMLFGDRLAPRASEETSLGSGVIVRPDGVVVTNAHVIKGADEITVALKDRREFRARVLLVDAATDLAVLQVDAADLPALSFRSADAMEVGDLVLAIGNPFGVGQTVTSGIVSAQTRSTPDGGVFIQTDAAINPGNSGGALVDMSGRLVGINTMILSPSGGSNGIGFAVPADLAKQAVASALSGNRSVARAWLGAKGQPVTQEIAESLGLAIPSGVILADMHSLSPLLSAGLRAGDVVLDVAGRAVTDMTSLEYRLGSGTIGESLELGYLRGGERLTTSVALMSAPETPEGRVTEIAGRNPLSGAIITNLNPALAQEEGIDPVAEGVAVLDTGRGIARRFGVRRGDILRDINGFSINTVDDVEVALREARGRWAFIIERNGRRIRLAAAG